MFDYLIGGFFLGIFAGMAIVISWNHYWDTHGEKPFGPDDLSKLATQQKPTEEAMLRANPSCGMDGCLWERDWEKPSNA